MKEEPRGTQRNPEDRAGAKWQWQGRSSPVGKEPQQKQSLQGGHLTGKKKWWRDGGKERVRAAEQWVDDWLAHEKKPRLKLREVVTEQSLLQAMSSKLRSNNFLEIFSNTQKSYSWEQVKGQQLLGKMMESCSGRWWQQSWIKEGKSLVSMYAHPVCYCDVSMTIHCEKMWEGASQSEQHRTNERLRRTLCQVCIWRHFALERRRQSMWHHCVWRWGLSVLTGLSATVHAVLLSTVTSALLCLTH